MVKKLFIGEKKDSKGWGTLLPYENALLYYVYGRFTYGTDWFLFLLPSVFYFYHHSIELSLKTLLKLKKIDYSTKPKKGHCTSYLLKLVIDSGCYSDEVNQLGNDEDLMLLLTEMDRSYTNNKYEFVGYNVSFPLRDVVDKIISTIFREVNLIMSQKKPPHALAILYVPEEVEKAFLKDLQVLFGSYHVLSQRKP